MTETLRIDTGLVLDAGGRLLAVAGAIPPPPDSYNPPGGDALSIAIAGKVAEIVDPVIAQLPVSKEELTKYAQKVVNAATTYDAVDRQIAEEILKRVEGLDDAAAGGVSTAGGAAPPTVGAAQQASPTAQMAQMPMQMAQQAAQAPMQMAGFAGAFPQAMQQGVQQAVQQVGQLAEMGKKASASDESASRETTPEPERDEAAAGGSEERAPAPTSKRSAEGGPEIAL